MPPKIISLRWHDVIPQILCPIDGYILPRIRPLADPLGLMLGDGIMDLNLYLLLLRL